MEKQERWKAVHCPKTIFFRLPNLHKPHRNEIAMTIYTTLNRIRAVKPCGVGKADDFGFRKLLNFLGKTTSDDESLKFSTIIESNGALDAIWCTRSVYDTNKKEVLLLAADCAEHVLPIWENWAKDKAPHHLKFPRNAIYSARRLANGEIGQEEMETAVTAVKDAAYAASLAAWSAAPFLAAILVAAAAWDAAEKTKWDATWSNAWSAALSAELQAQGELLVKHFG